MNKLPTYIPSFEAEELYDLSVRGIETDMNYNGMQPFSLELIQLRKMKEFTEKKIKLKGNLDENGNPKVKYQSDAIINVKFKNKVKDGKEITSFVRGYESLIDRLSYQIKKLHNQKKYCLEKIELSQNSRKINTYEKTIANCEFKIERLTNQIEHIENNNNADIYQPMTSVELRNYLYTQGFTYKGNNYVLYKNTASKARNSQTLFILDTLHKNMQEWSRMGLKFEAHKKYDIASLKAYESLVSSSIIGTINIHPDNIFIIADEYSKLETEALEVGNDLKASFNPEATIKNNIWDGQALIDVSLMRSIGKEKAGSAQLRMHFFKCCSFNTNIQKFLRNKHTELTNPLNEEYDPSIPVNFDEWKLTDLYGNVILASKILLITTPSALKFMKFAEKGKEKEAYQKWCERVIADNCQWGICKFEKSSKHNGMIRSSYQMINTIDAQPKDIKELAKYEVDYIEQLQNNNDEFVKYLKEDADLTNCNNMLVDLYNKNNEVANLKFFRTTRKSKISAYRTKVKGGKVRLQGEYCTVVSSPYEMLLSVIGKLKDENGEVISHTLHNNEVYTTLHKFNETYTVARNPHNAMNNYYKVHNKRNDLIKRYFNFADAPNIIVITAIKSPILVVANGMDTDGDTLAVFSDKQWNCVIDKTLSNRKYPVIINSITSPPDPVELTNENLSLIDEKGALSQRWIGSVTNTAQYLVSVLWDMQNDDKYIVDKDKVDKEKDMQKILEEIAVLVVISNVAIDFVKKKVEVDVEGALRSIKSIPELKIPMLSSRGKLRRKSRKKPMFWKYVTSSKPKNTVEFNTPMDMLIKHIDAIPKAEYNTSKLGLMDIVRDLTPEELQEKYDNKQIADIIEGVKEYKKTISRIHAIDHIEKDDKYRALNDAAEKVNYKISKKKIKISTLHRLLLELSYIMNVNTSKKEDTKAEKRMKKDMQGIALYIMNYVYMNNKENFLSLIIDKETN